MTRRLLLVLVLAFVVGIVFTAYAEVQNVKVSGDITAYGIDRSQFGLKDRKHGGTLRNETGFASITRVKVDADLTDNISTTVRLLNERYWGSETENGPARGENTNIDIDLAYATLKEFLYSPLTITAGRQELHFGNDMVVGAVATNRATNGASSFTGRDEDLSVRHAFDAIRATLDYNPLVIDLVTAKIKEKVLNNADDQNLYGINAKYDTGMNNTTVEGYWFTKDSSKKGAVSGKANEDSKRDKVHTIGALVKSLPVEDLSTSLEVATQTGTFFDNLTYGGAAHNDAARRRAWAAEAGVNYKFSKVKTMPSLTALAAWFSGPKDPSLLGNNGRKTYTGWDPMFENQKYGDIANALFAQTNARLIGGIASIKPIDDVTFQGEYYAYWWDRKYPNGSLTPMATTRGDIYTMTDKRFAGQELDLKASYDYTEDVQFSLLGGVLVPGKAFDKANRDNATELIGSMKVTF